jgi:hypothetical protein
LRHACNQSPRPCEYHRGRSRPLARRWRGNDSKQW